MGSPRLSDHETLTVELGVLVVKALKKSNNARVTAQGLVREDLFRCHSMVIGHDGFGDALYAIVPPSNTSDARVRPLAPMHLLNLGVKLMKLHDSRGLSQDSIEPNMTVALPQASDNGTTTRCRNECDPLH